MADRRGVHRMLNPAGYPLSGNLLRNKAQFARHVASAGLRAPAAFDGEGDLQTWLKGRSAIIAKPGYSSKGQGVSAYRHDGGQWHSAQKCFDANELASHLRSILGRHGVVQELLATHPELDDLSPGALPTLRVVTCLDESGEPESCGLVLRLSSGGPRPVDNFNAGGLAVRIDLAGRCLKAFRANGNSADSLAAHPSTGVALVGQAVPNLDEAVELAKQAHRSLPAGYAVVGWDIGLTDCGPMVIEGNWNPGTDIIQLVDGTGLDRTRLGELYRYHLERVSSEAWRSVRPIEW